MTLKKGKLIIARHHESEWNKLQKWTGVYDADLTPHGIEMSKKMATLVETIRIDKAISSELKRAYKTLEVLLKTAKINIPIEKRAEINERDYGDYTGENKWKMKEILGEEKFNSVRRDWNCPVPNGETLKMVYERVIPFYKEEVLPSILDGKIVIIVAHTNSIRALVKYIEQISDKDIKKMEMPFGTVFIYEVDDEGKAVNKETRKLKEE